MEFLKKIITSDFYNQFATDCRTVIDRDITYKIAFAVCKIDSEEAYLSLPELVLHHQELEVYKSYKHTKRRQSYLLGRFASKVAIAELNQTPPKGVNITHGALHQPVINSPNNDLDISISHTDTIGFAAVYPSSYLLGIDVEQCLEKNVPYIVEHLTSSEREYAKGYIYNPIVFWSAKEALSKCLKIGLTSPFHIYEIKTLEMIGGFYIMDFLCFPQFRCISFYVGSFVFSVVVGIHLILDLDQLREKVSNIINAIP